MTGRIIETDADVHEGMLALSAMCPRMKAAYEHAVTTGYRFYSYGDGSLLERAE